MDPHEIANVFGTEGVRLMHEEGQAAAAQSIYDVPILRASDE